MAPRHLVLWPLAMALLLGGLTLSALRPQAAYPETATLVTMLLMAAGWLGAWCVGPLRAPNRMGAVVFIAAMTWMTVWALGVWRAPVQALGRPAIVEIAQGALAFVAMAWLARADGERARGAVVWWIAGLASVMGLHAIYQVFGNAAMPGTYKAALEQLARDPGAYDPETLEGIRHALREARASSWWGSPNIFAGLLAAAIPLLAGLALRRGAASWVAIAMFAPVCWALMLTGSRGGLLGAAAGLGVAVVVAGLAPRARSSATTTVATIILLIGGGLGATAWAQGTDSGARWLGTSTIGQRLMYWESAWAIWRENLLLGQGPGAFLVLYPQHRLAAANETLYAHSWLFDWGCQVGLVGLGAFVVWVAASFAQARCITSIPMRAGLVGCAAAMLAHGLVEFTLQVAEMYLLLAVVLGVVAGADDRSTDPMADAALLDGPLRDPTVRRRAFLMVARVLVIGACGACCYRWQNPATRGESLRDLIPLVEAADTEAIIDQAIGAEPDHPTGWESKGLWLLQRGDLIGAEAAIEQARRLNPYSARLCESLGRVRVEQGRLNDAITLQREAIARHPVDIEHRLRLVELLLAAGDDEAARAAFDEALATTRTRNAREVQWRDAVAARLSGS